MIERETLHKARRALLVMEEQVAGFGSLNVPVHLKLELEDKQQQISELAQRIEDVRKGQLTNPYRGLFAFREKDAPFFFGRETFIKQLYQAVKYKPMVAVIGPSGSGKSSVVFAGLLPQLRQEAGWLVTSFRPGKQPFQSLAAALLPLLETELSETARLVETNRLAAALLQGDVTLSQTIKRIVEKSQKELQLLLVADQFEELYTLTREETERQKFLDLLLSTLNSKTTPLKLVLTLRADFFNAALSYRPLSDALQLAQQNLGPLLEEELQQAITRPAQELGMGIEDGLTERILEAVNKRPGDLPLLEFALTELWERQDKGELTNAAYNQIGGVEGALARYADEVYQKLSEDEQKRLQRVFTQLVQPGAGTEDTRRRATRAEVGEQNWSLVTELATARLVVSGLDESRKQETVEVVHEALISKWQKLSEWMAADRDFRTWQERLRAAMRQWDTSQRDEGALLRGTPLAEAEGWLEKQGRDLNQPEQEFILVGVKLRDQDKQDREEQQRQRAETAEALVLSEQKGRRRQRTFLIGVSILLVVAIAISIVAIIQTNEAHRQATISKSQALSAYAQNELETDPTLSGLLAIEAARLANSPDTLAALPQAASALRQALSHPWSRATLSGHTDTVYSAVFSPDGKQVLTASVDGTARLWSAVDGKALATLSGHTARVYSAVFSPDGKQILTASEDKTARLWSVVDGKPLATLSGHTATVYSAVFSPDGKLVLTASYDGTAILQPSAIDELIKLAESRTTRRLTDEERQRFGL